MNLISGCLKVGRPQGTVCEGSETKPVEPVDKSSSLSFFVGATQSSASKLAELQGSFSQPRPMVGHR